MCLDCINIDKIDSVSYHFWEQQLILRAKLPSNLLIVNGKSGVQRIKKIKIDHSLTMNKNSDFKMQIFLTKINFGYPKMILHFSVHAKQRERERVQPWKHHCHHNAKGHSTLSAKNKKKPFKSTYQSFWNTCWTFIN